VTASARGRAKYVRQTHCPLPEMVKIKRTVLDGNGFFGSDFLRRRRISFNPDGNVAEKVAKPARIRQAGLVACEQNTAVDADMRRPVLDCEAVQGDRLGLILMSTSMYPL
jgi:hypothetical protein